MDELSKLIAERTGLSEDVAEKVVAVVWEYLEERVPEPFRGQVQALLGSGGGSGGFDMGDAQSLMKGLGNLFGGNEETTKE
ncbi:MAG: DUF2267 domain-containing protein [Ardenticatenia bacterium]|uniref:DUF2267 domain-containing protein n=1 Tax=Ardenticatena maritima TaxID=872965 RepID=A0A0M8KBJ8_9CHLR|nr:hypothetical protein [Ardenticatena maritima]KPL86343.1 hypothetical protein SE16_13545 [Ardenticatena maritima]RME11208.1 MAG: DUF2267 domain-containing protein [Ardenticatenia bacterium]GAP64672.1 hypothetical protein ARMA_3095 [Ardenticatena maritima]